MFWFDGGAEQIVVSPADLKREHLGPRQFTGWGYDEGDIQVKAHSRRHFQAGEVMPDFPSDWGQVIWQWDERQGA
ncbi:hypothetical protein C1704_16480 [Caldimonas caldifontis]|uniref:Uncharacterized protein n=2 Tax=Caldimonas caldifontis TaxID=1452508 RepID=A0A2S5SQV1_9BURK|nr:hypothetical protein C1704_16480 [Caldimonas caldifontis]